MAPSASPTLPLVALLAILIFVVAVRVRLAPVPLQRDEGEYAYAGQLILRGVPPYALAYNMKFPGAYYAYALLMAVFGQTATGIHLGLIVVNALSIVLVFAIGRRLLGDGAGIVAASLFALLSVDRGIMGIFAHATHFVVLFALAGFWLLLRSGTRGVGTLLGSGACLGAAVLMKQHAAFFVPLALGMAWLASEAEPGDSRAAASRTALTALGMALPLAAVALLFAGQGVLGKAWFWTIRYAKEYVGELPLSRAYPTFSENFHTVTAATLALWLPAVAGLALLAFVRVERRVRAFLLGLLVTSFLSICPGFFFRPHYFITILPAVALLGGAAWSLGARFLARPLTRQGAVVICAALLAVPAIGYLMNESDYLFSMSAREVSRLRYGANPFIEAPDIARYIRERTTESDRIAVVGSEPEIYFYSGRRSATGYIYTYPLMESQAFARQMQAEMIREIEAVHPKYLVFAQISGSWLARPTSDMTIMDWINRYTQQCYTPVGVADIYSMDVSGVVWGAEARTYKPRSRNLVYTFERISDAPCAAPPTPRSH